MSDQGRTPSSEQVQRGADALAAWVNPAARVGWAEEAARVVLNAALADNKPVLHLSAHREVPAGHSCHVCGWKAPARATS